MIILFCLAWYLYYILGKVEKDVDQYTGTYVDKSVHHHYHTHQTLNIFDSDGLPIHQEERNTTQD